MAKRRNQSGLHEEVIDLRFPNKVTKGGRTLGVAALVAVGNGNGRVGIGYGKARGVPQAIEKAVKDARDNMQTIYMVGDTLGHEITVRQDGAHVMLKPARPGTGVKAGATVRAIMEVLGVRNALTKVYGSTNPVNVARATMAALERIRSPEEVAELRGVDVKLHHPQSRVGKKQETAEQVEEQQPEEEARAEAPETEEVTEEEAPETEQVGEEPVARAEAEEDEASEEAEVTDEEVEEAETAEEPDESAEAEDEE